MKRKREKLLSMLCAFALALSLLPTAFAADATLAASTNAGGVYGKNAGRWADTVQSYLYVDGSNLVRVEHIGDAVVVEEYDASFCLQSSRIIPMELPLWGGFYAGEQYNFLVFGQRNPDQSNDVEVIRTVKYDKDWNRLGAASLKGANTTIPFDAGGLSCAEYNGMLYVRTCHEMYTSTDGRNHQANVTFSVRQSDMKITDSVYAVANVGAGYVSHSFNQYIMVDEQGRLVALDHGDAYPRSAVLVRYKAKAGKDSFANTQGNNSFWRSCDNVNIALWTGNIGANTTGACVTGFAETKGGYLSAFSDTGKGADSTASDPMYVYLAYTSKDNFSDAGTTIRQLTSDGYCAQPRLVPTGTEGGYILWQTAVLENGRYRYSADTIQYAVYAADGSIGDVVTAQGELSDCQPILFNGRVVWYTTNASTPIFYTLDSSGVKAHTSVAGDRREGNFNDVPAEAWFANYVNKAAEAGLVQGVGNQSYDPNGKLTLAEAVTLAARLHAQHSNGTIPSVAGEWYMGAYEYCIDNGIIRSDEYPVSSMKQASTRFQMVDILDRAVADSQKAAIHEVTSIPDVAEYDPYGDVVYRWYRAGIIEGDEQHRFNGNTDISRAEIAAILCRLTNLTPRV